jgi:hypothetical protein
VKLIFTNETSDDEDADSKEELHFQVNIYKTWVSICLDVNP